MGRWRSMMFVKHRSIQEWADRQRCHFLGERQEEWERGQMEEQMLADVYYRHRQLRVLMRAWVGYHWEKQSRERRVGRYAEVLEQRRVKGAVLKWRERKQATDRLRVRIQNFNDR